MRPIAVGPGGLAQIPDRFKEAAIAQIRGEHLFHGKMSRQRP